MNDGEVTWSASVTALEYEGSRPSRLGFFLCFLIYPDKYLNLATNGDDRDCQWGGRQMDRGLRGVTSESRAVE